LIELLVLIAIIAILAALAYSGQFGLISPSIQSAPLENPAGRFCFWA
jgi:Tfp pilus assembly protein FimT